MNGRTPWQAFQVGLPGAPKGSKMTEQEERKAASIAPRRTNGKDAVLSHNHLLCTLVRNNFYSGRYISIGVVFWIYQYLCTSV